jgi:spermidine synthase
MQAYEEQQLMSRRPSGLSGATAFEPKTLKLVLIGFIFFISGISALIYQVAWQRILVFHSGVGIYSISMIVAAFLAGLGLGSYWGGVLSKQTSPLAALRVFAVLELGIGLFAFLSCYVFYDLLYLQYPYLFSNVWRAGALHFLLLLLPTTMMGMSLPFITRATVLNTRTASRTIGYLYGINVLGAALGALLAPWILIRLFGIDGAVYFGAAGNIFTGLVALAVGSRVVLAKSSHEGDALAFVFAKDVEPPNSRPFALWLTLYTVSGFCAISLEIIWFRLIDVGVKSSAFTFGTVLAIFLLGLGAGSVIGGFLSIHIKRPLKLFLIVQCALLIYTSIALSLLVFAPPDWPFYSKLVEYWADTAGTQPLGPGLFWRQPGLMFGLYMVLPISLYGFPTLFMGLSFGILQRAVQDDPRTSGFKVGILQSGNIVGNVAGSLLTGLLLLNFLGTAGAIKFLMGFGLVFAAIGIYYYGGRWVFSLLGSALILLLLTMPNGNELWDRLHGLTKVSGLIEEDATAVVALTPVGNDSFRLNVNGKSHSYLPYGGIHSMLGAAPAIIHPSPKDIAVIGLGSGDTAWAAGCREATHEITVFEIAATENKLLQKVVSQGLLPKDGKLRTFLEDPRTNIITADGRNALALNDKRYDVIEVDVLRPWTAYSGNLYSVEFYSLTSRKLKPGGLVRSWALGERNTLAFRKVFPYVIELKPGKVLGWKKDATALIGSNEPIALDLGTWLARLDSPRLQSYLGPQIIGQLSSFLRTARLPLSATDPNLKPNRDLFPRDEFRTPRGR